MNAKNLFTALAAVLFAGSAFAADVPAANAAATSVAATSLNVPAVAVDKSSGPTRAQVRAEAEASLRDYRTTDAAQFDWLKN
jgi:hypothetical protein